MASTTTNSTSNATDRPRLTAWQFTIRTAIVAGVALVVLALAALVLYAGRVLLLGLAGLIFGVFLTAATRAVSSRTGLSYRMAWGAFLLVFLAVVALGWWAAAAQVWDQIREMTDSLPKSLEQIRQTLSKDRWGQWVASNAKFVQQVIERAGTFSRTAGVANLLLDAVVDFFVIVFVGLYLSAEPDFYRRGLLKLVPPDRQERADEVLSALAYNIRWWLYGRITAMVVIGVLTAIGLLVVGMPVALTLAAIAGLLQIIPTLGPMIAAVPAVLIAWSQGTRMVGYVIVLYLIVQFIETYIVTPLIQRKAVKLPPALVLLTMIMLGITGGILGLLVAAPLTVIVVVLVKKLYVGDVLGYE